ncbi:MAG: hypothetical protein AB7S26_19120 [Sandaracinaceae bacterium]
MNAAERKAYDALVEDAKREVRRLVTTGKIVPPSPPSPAPARASRKVRIAPLADRDRIVFEGSPFAGIALPEGWFFRELQNFGTAGGNVTLDLGNFGGLQTLFIDSWTETEIRCHLLGSLSSVRPAKNCDLVVLRADGKHSNVWLVDFSPKWTEWTFTAYTFWGSTVLLRHLGERNPSRWRAPR